MAVGTLRGHTILVTGATGFLGRHLTRALVGCGADVHVLVRQPVVLDALLRVHYGDITDVDSVRAAVRASRPDVVFHLAAYGTTVAQRDEALMSAVNVGGAENLCAALNDCLCRLVQTGTPAEYAAAAGPITEDHPCRPATAYGRTVHEAISCCREWARRRGRQHVVIRPFGPFGPGDRLERLIPQVVRQLIDGETVPVTEGQQLRDFAYVDDHVAAMVAAAAVPLSSTTAIYNTGGGQPVRVRDLIETIARSVGPAAMELVRFGALPYRPDDLAPRYADVSAARRDLAYGPHVTLQQGLRRTVESMRHATPICQ